jgi:ATP sulfurylase
MLALTVVRGMLQHFSSILTDPYNLTGNRDFLETTTDFNRYPAQLQAGGRVSMPVPVILPINAITKADIGQARRVTLVGPSGRMVAVLSDPEVFVFRKEEVIARVFGGWDPDHPYIARYVRPTAKTGIEIHGC